jgi:hypothetical protein
MSTVVQLPSLGEGPLSPEHVERARRCAINNERTAIRLIDDELAQIIATGRAQFGEMEELMQRRMQHFQRLKHLEAAS